MLFFLDFSELDLVVYETTNISALDGVTVVKFAAALQVLSVDGLEFAHALVAVVIVAVSAFIAQVEISLSLM